MVCIHLINDNTVDIGVEMTQKRFWKSKGELMKRFDNCMFLQNYKSR